MHVRSSILRLAEAQENGCNQETVRSTLRQQLSSDAEEGYPISDATAAVDSLVVDWNENAARSAKQYLNMSGFSCRGLIEQLSSEAGEQYTVGQATYGARQAGAC
jgi:hypothetical protein